MCWVLSACSSLGGTGEMHQDIGNCGAQLRKDHAWLQFMRKTLLFSVVGSCNAPGCTRDYLQGHHGAAGTHTTT